MATPIQIPNDMTYDERVLLEIIMLLLGGIFTDAIVRGPSPVLDVCMDITGKKLSEIVGQQPIVTQDFIQYVLDTINQNK